MGNKHVRVLKVIYIIIHLQSKYSSYNYYKAYTGYLFERTSLLKINDIYKLENIFLLQLTQQ